MMSSSRLQVLYNKIGRMFTGEQHPTEHCAHPALTRDCVCRHAGNNKAGINFPGMLEDLGLWI